MDIDVEDEGLSVIAFGNRFPLKDVTSNMEMIKFFLMNPKIRKELDFSVKHSTVRAHCCRKTKEVGQRYRERGVAYYIKETDSSQRARLKQSLTDFNMALLHSSFETPEDRIETSKLFGNRSAVFYDLGRHADVLLDVEMSLNLGYPFPHKVLIRKARSLLVLQRYQEALDAVTDTEAQIIQSEHKFKIKAIKEEAIRTIGRMSKLQIGLDSDENFIGEDQSTLNKRRFNTRTFVENPAFAAASKRTRIGFDANRSRHVVASEHIDPGDILFDEVPFASTLLPSVALQYCEYCHAFLGGYLLPCQSCACVGYCSVKCRNSSWNEYHRIECHKHYFLEKLGLAHLASRIVFTAGIDKILSKAHSNKKSSTRNSISDFSQTGDSYDRIYSLLEHSNQMCPVDLFTYSKTAAAITVWLLSNTHFFENRSENDAFEVGGVILKHIFQLISNAQRITSFLRGSDGALIDSERVNIGSGIYASTSLMNHSCDPNVSTNYKWNRREGRRLIVKATRKIVSGDEVCNSYGVTYRRHDHSHRSSVLTLQYYFTCSCSNCEEEQESGHSFVEEFESCLCACGNPVYVPQFDPPCVLTCSKCGRTMKTENLNQFLEEAEKLAVKGREIGCEKGHNLLLRSQKILAQVLAPSHRLIARSEDALAQSCVLNGNLAGAVPHLKRSLDYVAYRFGPTSNEFGNELRKFAELMDMLENAGLRHEWMMEGALSCLENYFPSTA